MDTSLPSIAGKKILWVEDDTFLRDIVASRLASENLTIFYSGSGEDALAIAQKEHPDMIMLDILLPGMNGIEILRRLKADVATKDIPVIMFSNVDDEENVQASTELGAAGFFVKASVTLDAILAKMRDLLV